MCEYEDLQRHPFPEMFSPPCPKLIKVKSTRAVRIHLLDNLFDFPRLRRSIWVQTHLETTTIEQALVTQEQ